MNWLSHLHTIPKSHFCPFLLNLWLMSQIMIFGTKNHRKSLFRVTYFITDYGGLNLKFKVGFFKFYFFDINWTGLIFKYFEILGLWLVESVKLRIFVTRPAALSSSWSRWRSFEPINVSMTNGNQDLSADMRHAISQMLHCLHNEGRLISLLSLKRHLSWRYFI